MPMPNSADSRRLIDLPGVRALEGKALMNPRYADADARSQFAEIDECSREIFGLTAAEAADIPRPQGWDRIERKPVRDQVAAIEAEGSQLPEDDRLVFLTDLGLQDSGLDRIIRAGYDLLGLITYFTVGPKETRAWTIIKGTKAPGAAGVIHGDFERGFIAAETTAYEDYVQYKGEAGAREAGKLRVEGRDYIVKDGDVLLFRFNV